MRIHLHHGLCRDVCLAAFLYGRDERRCRLGEHPGRPAAVGPRREPGRVGEVDSPPPAQVAIRRTVRGMDLPPRRTAVRCSHHCRSRRTRARTCMFLTGLSDRSFLQPHGRSSPPTHRNWDNTDLSPRFIPPSLSLEPFRRRHISGTAKPSDIGVEDQRQPAVHGGWHSPAQQANPSNRGSQRDIVVPQDRHLTWEIMPSTAVVPPSRQNAALRGSSRAG